MASSVPESVFEGFEFSEANTVLLMTLMEETQEDHDLEYYGDDRLMSMIQSLEAEISSSRHDEVGQVDGQDCSTSSVCEDDYSWVDMELVSANSSSSPLFDDDEMMNAWSPCAAAGDDSAYSDFYYGVLLERQIYLTQGPSDVAF